MGFLNFLQKVMVTSSHRDAETIPYELQIAPRNKHVYLRIRDGKLFVRANARVSRREIESIIEQKRQWIEQKLLESQKLSQNPTLKIGSQCYFLGEVYPLTLRKGVCEAVTITEQNTLLIESPRVTYEVAVAMLQQFYLKHSKQLSDHYLEQWCPRMGLYPNKISFRNNKTRWGSCSGKNNISLNSNLAQLSPAMIEYVIVHELAHIQQKNHSSAFWAIVAEHLPDYQNTRQALRALEKHIRIYH